MTCSMLAMFTAGFALVLVPGALAQSDPLSERKALMKGNLEGAQNLVKMVRGQSPFEQEKVNAAFEQWAKTAKKLPNLFPTPPAQGEDTRALSKIWENKPDFEAKIASFEKAVSENKDKATSVDELKAVMPRVSDSCNGCHELYRRPK
jgi:cytochrome c556